MANKNRVEVSVAIQAQAATVGETEYKDNLDTEMIQNLVFRKDVSDADTANAATKTIDFLDIDYFEITQDNDVTFTLNNIQQGEVKFLKITKAANDTVAFAVGTDVSQRKTFITTQTVVIYRVTNKDGSLYIESINIDNDVNGEYITKELDIPAWNMNTTPVLSTMAHGLTSSQWKSIIVIGASIYDDSDVARYDLLNTVSATSAGARAASVGVITSTIINLAVTTGSLFQTSNEFDGIGANRGKMLIKYIP